MWLGQGIFNVELPDFLDQDELLEQAYAVEGKLIDLEITNNVYRINLLDIPIGYYLLYIETEDVMCFDNIIVNH